MRMRVVEVDFTDMHDWLFRLLDNAGNEAFIMNKSFYDRHHKKSPVVRQTLDYLDCGYWVDAVVEKIGQRSIVTSYT